jgi:hypothetical protein
MTDIRDILIDGIDQMFDWFDEALVNLTPEQTNWLPEGKTVSIGFNAWHIFRTADNITNFVFQKQPTLWQSADFAAKFGLPPVAQGTGMSMDEARSLKVNDLSLLRDYGSSVRTSCLDYLKQVDPAALEVVQMIKPLGEMTQWKVFRQVVMTHGFMHLGEVNAMKGQLGLQFSI